MSGDPKKPKDVANIGANCVGLVGDDRFVLIHCKYLLEIYFFMCILDTVVTLARK